MLKAFSLVELSIVLVILGLLTGGILAGQSLIRAAELRSVSTEYQRYYTALQSFRTKYYGLPGDLRNATDFWGKLSAYCNSDPGTASTNGTCNGDGDGIIDVIAPDIPDTTAEEWQAWRQMALAGLIEGQYSGVTSSTSTSEYPLSRLKSGRWRYRTLGDYTGAVGGTLVSTFAVNYGTVFELWSMSTTGGYILSPEEAWNIDTKIDDGKPAQGRLIIRPWEFCTTATARTELTAEYNVSDRAKLCATAFVRNL